ncbi:M50 family metallopeptidase [Ornithinibacillus halophilus]|uniref:Stage IV sporulation protein FB n=1 Tax=Ornithinibacillus halophilus TaxID=930117 RepID=A0A1M5DF02_9BACI|nr:M50 family metallopeptidase [Ornithinibacillus halophilus]SHF65547.1 stage IV sporulation protein FB [Ornithinibacillus halophilus]
MTIHKFIPPIRIHPILIAFILISILTGTFVELFIILSIVFIHEFGHFAMAKLFNWRIRSVMLWVFGGVMETDEHGGKPIYQEVLVTIAGPMQHLFIYGFIVFSTVLNILPTSILELIFYYNTVILLFNLLPIWPLDGGKLLFLFLSKFIPFRKAYNFVIISSMVISILLVLGHLLFFKFTLSIFLIFIFLFMENRVGWKQRYYVFLRFLLQRFEGENQVKAVRPIVVTAQTSLMDVFTQFRRDIKHSIYITLPDRERISIDENDCLRSYFYEKELNKTIGELAYNP